MNRILIAALLFFGLSSAALAQVPAGGLMNIGVAAAVRGAVNAQAPGQAAGRVIGSGKPVYLNDHITTGPDSRLQILLLDETTFTLGPNSDMVLDEFVYDPKTSAGKVSAKISAGAFRFITGKVAQKNPANMKVALPVGTIGIRGTMVAGHTNGHDAEIVLVGPGPDNNAQERRGGITFSNEHGGTSINASGYGVTVVGGGRPSRGFRFSPAQLDAILDDLEPKHTAGNGGPADAAKNSGDVLAHGGINFQNYQTLDTIAANLDQTKTFASQQACVADGAVDCWSDVIALQGGTVHYQNTGSLACSGSGCSSFIGGPTGSFFFAVNANFTGQTLGGGNSTVEVYNNNATPVDSVGVSAVAYSSFRGPAVYTLPSAATGNGGNFAGTTLEFLKVNGQPAAAMQINVNYTNTNMTGTGTATGNKINGAYNPG